MRSDISIVETVAAHLSRMQYMSTVNTTLQTTHILQTAQQATEIVEAIHPHQRKAKFQEIQRERQWRQQDRRDRV